ncbi:Nucleoside-diphosphate-sugar epimerase [Streptomyces sp. DvalAA-14]|uniref:NAD(P)H-binding protein n=1 Tax=unclassified Streptomyces TaxID=2593676 RepID=UPI00081B1F11|nr:MULTISPECIES: NAD(P)H-binding protein [unclassified Streptomyces]MYS19827.1 NAD(P)H-binding protein [Streptomyces sp. SID4948]SCD54292.1 Nucleoside-diphosphate-sugar epimerase [Streptomyces sp. DvalAA-14]
MRTVIAGGHGQIALRLERLLTGRGDAAVGLIRNPAQADDLREVGAEPVVLDLEAASVDEVASVLRGADAAVFAAGAGAGSGAERKTTVDRDAAVLLADAAAMAGVRRFLIVSSMGADAGATGSDPTMSAYLRAKGAADDAIRSRSDTLDWTILRPGALTDAAGTGRVRLAPHTGRGSVPRDDVAAVLVALLDTPGSAGLVLELVAGDITIEEAVQRAAVR